MNTFTTSNQTPETLVATPEIAVGSYWSNNGRYQATAEALQALIPQSGGCDEATPKLEALRKAINAYHDIFNNGGCNRAKEINRIFGVRTRDLDYRDQATFETAHLKTEPVMDRLILAAAKEAGIEVAA